jgi:hypothetical protein
LGWTVGIRDFLKILWIRIWETSQGVINLSFMESTETHTLGSAWPCKYWVVNHHLVREWNWKFQSKTKCFGRFFRNCSLRGFTLRSSRWRRHKWNPRHSDLSLSDLHEMSNPLASAMELKVRAAENKVSISKHYWSPTENRETFRFTELMFVTARNSQNSKGSEIPCNVMPKSASKN